MSNSKVKLNEHLARLKDFLSQEGVTAYVVGGFVRDRLLGRHTQDVDLVVATEVTQLAPRLASALGGTWVLLDEARDISRVAFPERLFLDLAPLHGEIEENLGARDFTIDAMAVKLGDKDIIDPLAGRGDLEQRLIRAVKEDVFQEDPARLLRAVRLAAELDFTIEPGTEKVIQDHAYLMGKVAGERVREELMRLFSLPRSYSWLRRLDYLGLLLQIIPELGAGKGVAQPKEHFWDVFDHSLETVRAIEALLESGNCWEEGILNLVPLSSAIEEHFHQEINGFPSKGLVKLAGLLHDIAKPQTKSLETGRIRFFGHSQEGATIARGIMERLRFSNREIKMVELMIYHHLRPTQMVSDGELPTRRAIYRFFRDTEGVGIDTLFLSLADHLAARGPQLQKESWQEHTSLVRYALEEHGRQQEEVKPPKLIDGHDIMRHFDLKPGPFIGELLEEVREAHAAGEIENREEALSLINRRLSR